MGRRDDKSAQMKGPQHYFRYRADITCRNKVDKKQDYVRCGDETTKNITFLAAPLSSSASLRRRGGGKKQKKKKKKKKRKGGGVVGGRLPVHQEMCARHKSR
eukprot:TRINITY_DN10811_c0_g3_i1.p1 TRINITY_DN10811_c0_g3~~TRINITY_DN10811_c0_g3_i1.p1  ORF type:complete len:102 (-),score=3.67 TRINITY_DN10811_c0_g3_i1:393-698(-)